MAGNSDPFSVPAMFAKSEFYLEYALTTKSYNYWKQHMNISTGDIISKLSIC